jgi:hypothetical protein
MFLLRAAPSKAGLLQVYHNTYGIFICDPPRSRSKFYRAGTFYADARNRRRYHRCPVLFLNLSVPPIISTLDAVGKAAGSRATAAASPAALSSPARMRSALRCSKSVATAPASTCGQRCGSPVEAALPDPCRVGSRNRRHDGSG